ncbi:MAG: zinc ribbon domain-containing protein [Coprobacillus sp.]
MKQCPHCHKDLPDDSTFCIYCGKPIEKINKDFIENEEVLDSKQKNQGVQTTLKVNPHNNHWGKIGVLLFLIALIGFDFVLATVLNAFNINYYFVFIISFILYILSIACGIFSLVIDYLDKKKGYEPNGSFGFSMVAIGLSFYIALINLTSVIMK